MDGLMEERVGLIGKVTGLLEMNIVAVKGQVRKVLGRWTD